MNQPGTGASGPSRGTTWLGPRRDLMLVPIAAVLGLGIAWLDSRPGDDATGVTVVLLLSGGLALAAASGRRPWLWALLIGVWTPLVEVTGPSGAASLAALVVAGIGAAIGHLVARLLA